MSVSSLCQGSIEWVGQWGSSRVANHSKKFNTSCCFMHDTSHKGSVVSVRRGPGPLWISVFNSVFAAFELQPTAVSGRLLSSESSWDVKMKRLRRIAWLRAFFARRWQFGPKRGFTSYSNPPPPPPPNVTLPCTVWHVRDWADDEYDGVGGGGGDGGEQREREREILVYM